MLLKKLGISKGIKRYTTLDTMPFYNWWKCYNGDPIYTRLEFNDGDTFNEDDLKAFNKLTVDFDNEFGVNSAKQDRNEKLKNVISLNGRFMAKKEDRDLFILNTVNKLNDELDKDDKKESFKIEDVVVAVERVLKITIDPRTTSVSKFKAYEKQAYNLSNR